MGNREQPGQTLAFLFTDIEGHSALWNAHPEAMAAALRDHDVLIAETVSSVGGRVVKTSGDGAMAVFSDVSRAIRAAVSLQRSLTDRTWPRVGQLRVRMGIHVGVADERDHDFFGPEVIRAARLCDAANGGQIVASRAVAELASDVSWLNLGFHLLRGFTAPTEVHQVLADGLGQRFPALRTLDAHPNTLPRFRTEFFGREDDIKSIVEHVERHRCVTLTGIGGCGKTRLAVEVAHDQLSAFADGVYFIDLAVVTDAARLWDAIASALQLDVSGVLGVTEASAPLVLRFLSNRRVLILLDNCEHLLDAAADVVDEILDATRDVVVLATSREGLHVDGEWMVPVPSLRPDTDGLQLFRDRATAAGATHIDDDTATRICERLDGLPLAIELAAARCGQVGVEEVAQRLSDRFRLLTGSRRRIPRQRTLEAALDWSHDQLAPEEQAVLRQLAVFSGSFSMAAAEKVAGASVDSMGSLVDKSLVQRAEAGRFRLLETVRAYGEQRLVTAGEALSARAAHRDWLLSETAGFRDDDLLLGNDPAYELLRLELPNLYAALDWCSDEGDWATVGRLACFASLTGAMNSMESLRPMLDHLRRALDADLDGPLRDRAFAAYTSIAYLEADGASARRIDLWTEATQGARHRDDGLAVITLCMAANSLDAVSRGAGNTTSVQRAADHLQRASEIASALEPQWALFPAIIDAVISLSASDWPRAAERAESVLRLRAELGLGRPLAIEVLVDAAARYADGRPLQAAELRARAENARGIEHIVAAELTLTALSAPSPNRSVRPLLVDRRQLDGAHPYSISTVLISAAVLAAREEAWPIAARLLAASRLIGDVFSSPPGAALYRVTVPLVRAALDKPTRDELIADARARGLPYAIDLAVDWLSSAPS